MGLKEGTGVNRKDTEKTQSSQGAAAASKLVPILPILAPRRASKDGCRFRCILCAVCRVVNVRARTTTVYI